MIICRKPWTLYDVDAAGATGVALLALGVAWFALSPWRGTWEEYRKLTAARTSVQDELRADTLKLAQFERGLTPLAGAVEAEAARVPSAGSFSQLLRRVTDLAKESQLELLNVAPQPTVSSGVYSVSDIQIGARGTSRDFIRFLDRLAQGNPYQSLQSCAISRAARETEPAAAANCELTWTVRLYLLPEGAAGPASAAPPNAESTSGGRS
jgi:Tfp pilus assembly protein PilO